MIRRLIKTVGDLLRPHLPAPMAAPETVEQRRRRWRLIGLLATMAMVTWMAPTLFFISLIGTALLWYGLALTILIEGTIWLVTKLRDDAAWFDACIQARRDEVGEP